MGHLKQQVHVVQLDIAWENPAANHARVAEMLQRAPINPGDLIVLPEMFATGFSLRTRKTIDHDGATLAFLKHISERYRVLVQGGRTIAATHPGTDQRARNVTSAVVYRDEGGPALWGEYAKIHPFQREAEVIEPGSDVVVYQWRTSSRREVSVCPAICFDLRFPELFREGLAKGAEVFALGACWPSVRRSHWRALVLARAIENQAFFIACNRVGDDPGPPEAEGLHYAGGSIVVSPRGEVLGELGNVEAVLSVPINIDDLDEWRKTFTAWKVARRWQQGTPEPHA